MQKLLADEENSLYAQGDLTLEQRLDAPGMHKSSALLNRSVSVLRERERISREFQPEGTEIPRVPGVAWTVYPEAPAQSFLTAADPVELQRRADPPATETVTP